MLISSEEKADKPSVKLLICITFLFLISCSQEVVRRPSGANEIINRSSIQSKVRFPDAEKVYSGSCMDGVHRLVNNHFLIELSSGANHRIPFKVPDYISHEIQLGNETTAKRIIDDYTANMRQQGLPLESANVRLQVSNVGGGVLYEDGYLDISALKLTNKISFPYTKAFILDGRQSGIAQSLYQVNNSMISAVAFENPSTNLLPHARTFIDQALREVDLSDPSFFNIGNMALQVYGKSKKLRTFWILSQPNKSKFGKRLYEDYLDFVMDIYRTRINVDEDLAYDLKAASMELMDRSISIVVTDKRLITFSGEGGVINQNVRFNTTPPTQKDIIAGMSLVMSRNPEEQLPSEMFRNNLSIARRPGEILVEATRRASSKGKQEISAELVFQILAALKGMKKSSRVVIEVDEIGYKRFSKYGFKQVTEPTISFRGKEYTLIADIDEAYDLMVKNFIRTGRDLQEYFYKNVL